MSDSDNIFREVQEDLRREQLARLWDKYGVYVLIAAGAVILLVGAFKGYRWYENKLASESGTAFFQAAQQVEEQKYADASTALAKLAKDAPSGYRLLAKLELAAVDVKEGKTAEAVALYDEIAADGGADGILKDFARVQGAAIRVDEAEPAEMARRLDKLDADTSPWRYSARELLALSAYRSGNTAESEKLLTSILSDPFAPAEMRKRAESLMALLVKAPGTGGSAEAGKPAAAPQKDAATQ
jgi:hypothetical protein